VAAQVAAQREEEWRKGSFCRSASEVQAEREARSRARSLFSRASQHAPEEQAVRVVDLARKIAVKSQLVLDATVAVGIPRRITHSSSLTRDDANKVQSYLESHNLL